MALTRDKVALSARLHQLQRGSVAGGDFEAELAELGRQSVALGEEMRAVGEHLRQLSEQQALRQADARARRERRILRRLRLGQAEKAKLLGLCILEVIVAGQVALKTVPAIPVDENHTVADVLSLQRRRWRRRSRRALKKMAALSNDPLVKQVLRQVEQVALVWLSRKVLQGDWRPEWLAPRPKVPDVALDDVVGLGAAKREATEVAEFLRAPARFDALGAKCPRGVLLTGPPGCGKTMLSKAIAAAAGVPFLEISGADFNHRYAGVGTAKVREIFARARKLAPAVIFIDEIDYIGRRRSDHGGSVETDRTASLTQFLTELDGFKGRDGIVVVATTNRADLLDEALLRPGRFDRQLALPLPDVAGREQILMSHARKVTMGGKVDWARWARRTGGFSGADLAALVNEAAVAAAREDPTPPAVGGVRDEHFQAAYSKALLGLPSQRRPSAQRQRLTAVHEAGHAVVNEAMRARLPEAERDGCRTVEHISILGQGGTGGNTQFASVVEGKELPRDRTQLLAQMAKLLGGRAGEHLARGPQGVTMGASSDIERATELAELMVRKGGLSTGVGPRAVGSSSGHSEHLLEMADREVGRLLAAAEAVALDALEKNKALWTAVADALVERESLDGAAFEALVREHGVVPALLEIP